MYGRIFIIIICALTKILILIKFRMEREGDNFILREIVITINFLAGINVVH